MASANLTSQISHFKSNNYAIIVAGGSGARMQSAVPKQFLLLKGKPVLMHTIAAFYDCDTKPQIILVLTIDFHAYWKQLCDEYNFKIPHQLVNGGETRFHSVKNGLDIITNEDDVLIAVHDAVRPLTSKKIIDHSYRHATEFGNAITAIKSRDSVRQIKDEFSTSLPREEIYLVQTPQTFKASQIKKAYLQPYQIDFTDDASVVEQAGFNISVSAGSPQNIKITFPEDISIAELLMGNGQ